MKKILSIALALVMVLGMGSMAFGAGEDKYIDLDFKAQSTSNHGPLGVNLEKTGRNVTMTFEKGSEAAAIWGENTIIEFKNGFVIYSANQASLCYIRMAFSDPNRGKMYEEVEIYLNGEKLTDEKIAEINIFGRSSVAFTINNTPLDTEIEGKRYKAVIDAAIWLRIDENEGMMEGTFALVEEDPTPQTLATTFATTLKTGSGQYDVAIAGYVEKNLVNGANVLTLAEIKTQPISVVVHNNNTGENRVMTQTTIEEMTVNVSGGSITNIELVGRVQTTGGTLERYTTTINI